MSAVYVMVRGGCVLGVGDRRAEVPCWRRHIRAHAVSTTSAGDAGLAHLAEVCSPGAPRRRRPPLGAALTDVLSHVVPVWATGGRFRLALVTLMERARDEVPG